MKKVIFTSIYCVLFLLVAGLANAQTRVQVIHNAADIILDTVDVYVNGVKFDNVAYRSATPLVVTTTSTVININDRNSVDSSDLVLARFNRTFTANQVNIVMVNGVANIGNYATNPDGRSIGVSQSSRNNISVSPANGNTSLNIFHGVTDAPAVDVVARPSATLANNARYGDATNNLVVSSTSTIIDVRDSNGFNIIKSYLAPLELFNRKSLAVFASGFLTPANNQNGPAFGVFVVDTNGGQAIELQAAPARVQLVHNSADVLLDSVDVWFNNNKVADNLAFRKATQMLSFAPGSYDITVSKKFSTDTNSLDALVKLTGVLLEAGKSYINFVNGLLDTVNYAANPDGISRGLSIQGSDQYSEGGLLGQVQLAFVHGTHDAPQVDVSRIGTSPVQFANDAAYKSFSPFVTTPSGNMVIAVTAADGITPVGSFRLNTAAFNGRSGVLFASGVFNTVGNPTNARPLRMMAVFSNGEVVQLTPLASNIQIIHNSPDSIADSVDIYINGVLTLDNFKYATATPFIQLNAVTPYVIGVAPGNSSSVADTFYATTVSLDTAVNYYAIATGLTNLAQYAPNPEGKNRAFRIEVYRGAQIDAGVAKNVDLQFYNGSPDMQSLTVRGVGQVQFTAKSVGFGGFRTNGYGIHTAQENVRFEVTDAVTGAFMTDAIGSFAEHQGEAGIVFVAGFKQTRNAAFTRQRNKPATFYVAWPDGNIDTMLTRFAIGINEKIGLSQSVSIQPNPATTEWSIGFELNQAATVQLAIYDITGKQISATQLQGNPGVNTFKQLTPLPQGVYFVELSTPNERVTQKLLITQ